MFEEKEPIDIVNYIGGHNDWHDFTHVILDSNGVQKSFFTIGKLNGENKIKPIKYTDGDDYYLVIETNKAYNYSKIELPRRIMLEIPNNKHGLIEIDEMIESLNIIKDKIQKNM